MAEIDYSVAAERINDGKCPVCGSDNREQDYDFDSGNQDFIRYYCLDCHSRWEDCSISFYSFHIYNSNFDEIDIKNHLGVIGHIPQILKTLLDMPEMLPAFMGIDEGLDELITERLSE